MQITISGQSIAENYKGVRVRMISCSNNNLNGVEGIIGAVNSEVYSFFHDNLRASGGCNDTQALNESEYQFSYNLGYYQQNIIELVGVVEEIREEKWEEVPINTNSLSAISGLEVRLYKTSKHFGVGILTYHGGLKFSFATNDEQFSDGCGKKKPGYEHSWDITTRSMGNGSSDLIKLEIKKANTNDTKLMETKKQIDLEITRKDGVTRFKFKIDPKIEELYKSRSSEVKESKAWTGCKFYAIPELLSDKNYKDELRNHRLFDDYGSGFYVDGLLNIAWIRTVGGEGEIIIKENVPFAELSTLAKQTIQFLRSHFEDYFREFTIKGSVLTEF